MTRKTSKKKVSTVKNVEMTNCGRGEKESVADSEPQAKKACVGESDDCLASKDPNVEYGPCGKPKLHGEEFKQLKKALRKQSTMKRLHPHIWLRDQGETAALSVDMDSRVPLFVSDIQHLIMYSQIGPLSPYTPTRWCQVNRYHRIRATNVLIIENLSLYHYVSHESLFKFVKANFTSTLEIINPEAYMGDIIQELICVPLTVTQMRKFANKFGTLEAAVSNSDDIFDLVRNMFPGTKAPNISDKRLSKSDKFPRTHLLLSGWQMVEENFPLPIKGLMETKYKGYVLTNDMYKDVTPFSPMYGIDCEMCMTTKDLELTRVSVVDENFTVVYEQLVKPRNKITNYLTQYSGITRQLLKDVTKTIEEVQEDLRKLLPPDAILVGQSLNNDLHALKMMHPYVIDTSIIFNITGNRTRKTKLQTLAREFLQETIQTSSQGHCSVEDSLASLKLCQLKLSKDLYFGDSVMSSTTVQVEKHPQLGHPYFSTCMLKQSTKLDKSAWIFGEDDIVSKYKQCTYKNPDAKNNKKINFVTVDASNIIDKLSEANAKVSLNIAHVKLSNEDSCNNPDVFQKVDGWVKKMYDNSVVDSLNIVLFSGYRSSNGCCFIQMKQ